MDITTIFSKYNIPFVTEGHPHSRDGWINVECPYCVGNPGYHLGITVDGTAANCWRCGAKSVYTVLSDLFNLEKKEIYQLLHQNVSITPTNVIKVDPKCFKIPPNTDQLQKSHKNYLIKRNFDPEYIENVWKVQGIGFISVLDNINYKHRLFIPIYWKNKLVTFQTRDITGKSAYRYIACPQNREIIEHKHILYGNFAKNNGVGICVEGVTDVWRLGDYSFATFGIKYTPFQVREIVRRFERVIVLYDDDPQAQQQAKKLSALLRFSGVDSSIVTIKGDPADLSQEEANHIVKNIIYDKKIISYK